MALPASLACYRFHDPTPARPCLPVLEGEALHAFVDQAHELLQQDDEGSGIAAPERQAAVRELLAQQRFVPSTVGELERLHDLWLDLDQPETANALLREHRDAALRSCPGRSACRPRPAWRSATSRAGCASTAKGRGTARASRRPHGPAAAHRRAVQVLERLALPGPRGLCLGPGRAGRGPAAPP